MGELIGRVSKTKDGLYGSNWIMPRETVSTEEGKTYKVTTEEELLTLPNGIYAGYAMQSIAPFNEGTLIKGVGFKGSGTEQFPSAFILFFEWNTGFVYFRQSWNGWRSWRKISSTTV